MVLCHVGNCRSFLSKSICSSGNYNDFHNCQLSVPRPWYWIFRCPIPLQRPPPLAARIAPAAHTSLSPFVPVPARQQQPRSPQSAFASFEPLPETTINPRKTGSRLASREDVSDKQPEASATALPGARQAQALSGIVGGRD